MDSVEVLAWLIMGGLAALVVILIVIAAMVVLSAAARLTRPRYRGVHTRAALAAAPIEGGPRDGDA